MNFIVNAIANRPKLPGLLILLISAAALANAFFGQYVLKIDPCILCIYQRFPYAAAGLFAFFAIIAKPGGFTQQAALVGCGLAFLIGSSIAMYHIGVEEHWWEAGCVGTQTMDMSLEDLKASILSEPPKPCDAKDWVIFGLSITVYNAVGSLFFALSSFTSLAIIRKLKASSI